MRMTLSPQAVRVLSPFLFVAAVPLVLAFVVTSVTVVEGTIGLHTWRRVGDVDAVIALAWGSATVFAPLTSFLTRREGVQFPRAIDHLRQTGLLYLLGGLSGTWLALRYGNLNGALSYAYVVTLFGVTVSGVMVNAMTLAVNRARR